MMNKHKTGSQNLQQDFRQNIQQDSYQDSQQDLSQDLQPDLYQDLHKNKFRTVHKDSFNNRKTILHGKFKQNDAVIKLYIVSTPIGNMKDITLRAIETLQDVQIILTERKSSVLKILNTYDISAKNKQIITYREDSHHKVMRFFEKFVNKGLQKSIMHVALISEAGTPLIADPGLRLLQDLKHLLGDKLQIIVVPGPSAVVAAFSMFSYALSPRFLFLSFWPGRKNRGIKILTDLENQLLKYKITAVFFVSKHDVKDVVKLLYDYAQKLKARNIRMFVGIAKELTKLHETIYEGSITQIYNMLQANKIEIKGEFVFLISLKPEN